MTQHAKLTLRIRAMNGPHNGKWLWVMSVSRGGLLPFQVTNWLDVLQHPNRYVFNPQFIDDKSAAFRPVSLQIAEGCLHVLKSLGIEAEIIQEPA